MSDDPIVQQAQQAEATRVDGPPPAAAPEPAAPRHQEPAHAEQRRQAISKEADFWREGPKTAALRAEMKKLGTPRAAEDQKKTEADAALSPAARRVQKANADPALFNPKDVRHDEARRELRLALADAASDDEKQAWENTPLKEKRKVYGLPDPPLPAAQQEEFVNSYGGHEGAFIGLARAEGLSGHQVRGLRDDAIQLGMLVAESGKPATDEALKALLDKHRVPAPARPALVKLWREKVEGTPS